jgi:hypothetical protein
MTIRFRRAMKRPKSLSRAYLHDFPTLSGKCRRNSRWMKTLREIAVARRHGPTLRLKRNRFSSCIQGCPVRESAGMEERELIRLAQAGDLRAFEQLVKGWREQVSDCRQIVGRKKAPGRARRWPSSGNGAGTAKGKLAACPIGSSQPGHRLCREQSRRATAEPGPCGHGPIAAAAAGPEQSPSG